MSNNDNIENINITLNDGIEIDKDINKYDNDHKDKTLTIAERHYQNHLKAVRKYQQKNRDIVNQKNINNYIKVKNTNQDYYNEILEQKKIHYNNNKDHILTTKKQYYIDNADAIKEKRRLYYHNVVKPRKELMKINKNIN